MFKFFAHSQVVEICATSKEVMLFHDKDFVLPRLACGFNSSSIHGSCHDVMVKVETLNHNVVFIRSYRCCVFYENTQWFTQLLTNIHNGY